jgi:hypothetical protein
VPRRPISVATASIHAGGYRGTTAQRRALTLRVAAGGAKLTALRFSSQLRCQRGSGARLAQAAPVGSRAWSIVGGRGLGSFDRRVSAHGTVVRVTGTFTSATRVAGTLRVTRSAGRCDSGIVRYAASLR